MKKVLITYGDKKFEMSKNRFIQNAHAINIFDEIIAYSDKDLSEELKQSEIINEKRGGGLWSWKPDVILTTLNKMEDGDILVYCDSGCTVYPCNEWNHIWKSLENHDIIAQRIYQRTDKWTRKSIIEYFAQTNSKNWTKCYQHMATAIILKATPFTRAFVSEWKDMMISHPEMVKDVTIEEKVNEAECFIENRHDQAFYSALTYKYLNNPTYKNKILTKWEHIEDYDIICPQAIRATRLRNGESKEPPRTKAKAILKRLVKDYIFRPFFYAPLQMFYMQHK
uniref:hypothetical protein n=1 Tax=Prevotella sp. TaxID=59823 RepID=UPI003FEFF7A5